MTNKTSDKNVANIEEDVNELKRLLYSDALTQYGKRKLVNYYDKRIQELEEENKKVKAQHIFTTNEANDEEKAELYDVIDKTLNTFLEKEKSIWQQEMTSDKMNLEEAINIVDAMYQDRYKIIQENDTIYVDRLKDVRFTNLEFASVILLREVQSLQSKLKNSIPKQVIIDVMKNNRNEIFRTTYLSHEQFRPYEMQVERINKIEQEILGEDMKNGRR